MELLFNGKKNLTNFYLFLFTTQKMKMNAALLKFMLLGFVCHRLAAARRQEAFSRSKKVCTFAKSKGCLKYIFSTKTMAHNIADDV